MSPGNRLFDLIMENYKEEYEKEHGTSFDDDMHKYDQLHPTPASIWVGHIIEFAHWLTSLIIPQPKVIDIQ